MLKSSCLLVSVLAAACLFALSGSAFAQDAEKLAKAREAYKTATSQADQALIAKHAAKEWAAAKSKADEAEIKAKGNEVKKAIDLYNRAAKEAKEAIELSVYAEASKAATAVADAKKAKENFEKSKPIVAALEAEKDLYAARDQLAQIEELIPGDPRLPAFRQKVKALPIPKNTQFIVGREQGRVPVKLVQIPAGTFTMGAPDAEKDRAADEGPQREVTISKPFYMSVCEITQQQLDAGLFRWPDKENPNPPANPGVNVTREEAMNFCKNACDDKAKRTVRLPTEAEWEYACRAGTKTRFSFGDDPAAAGDYAWSSANSDGDVHVGGQKKANPFGLFDIHGNVFEWVSDNYSETYPAGKAADPQGPEGGWNFLARGGSWRCNPLLARSAYRYIVPPNFRSDDIGFRIVVIWNLE